MHSKSVNQFTNPKNLIAKIYVENNNNVTYDNKLKIIVFLI